MYKFILVSRIILLEIEVINMESLSSIQYLYIILGILVLYAIIAYNSLVALRHNVKEAASDIDAQQKRRYDLIPNLVETVKAYAKHEKETLNAVIMARNSAMNNTGSLSDKEIDEQKLTKALKSIFALSENYPDLKSNTNFLELQRELTDTEDKIMASRRFYNSNVREINIAVETFPKNIVAKIFGFSSEKFFELDATEASEVRKPVKVKF